MRAIANRPYETYTHPTLFFLPLIRITDCERSLGLLSRLWAGFACLHLR